MVVVSLIVPVFNKKENIRGCLDSIISQTFRNFECILVDDGSTDGSGIICDQYMETDRRFKAVHKENGGVSSARNAGIDLAQGRYLMFCDADDILPENAMEALVQAAEQLGGQLTVGGFRYVNIDTVKNTIQTKEHLTRHQRQVRLDHSDALLDFWSQNNMLSACGKLFLKEIVRNNGLSFRTNLVVMEDFAFVLDYLLYCGSIQMIPETVYHYITDISQDVTQKRSRKDFFEDVLFTSEKLQDFLTGRMHEDAEKYRQISIYPTLRLAYDLLWAVEVSDYRSRIRKYRRIKQALKSNTFQKMLVYYKRDFKFPLYFCMRKKSIVGILFVNVIHKIFKPKK